MKRSPMKRTGRLKVKGRSRFPKRRTPGYAAFIREYGCCICGRPSECAHVMSVGSGGYDLDGAVPMCPDDHRLGPGAIHRIGQLSFETLHGIDLAALARVYGDVWRARHPSDTPSEGSQDAPDASVACDTPVPLVSIPLSHSEV